jgi:hypothetical protein
MSHDATTTPVGKIVRKRKVTSKGPRPPRLATAKCGPRELRKSEALPVERDALLGSLTCPWRRPDASISRVMVLPVEVFTKILHAYFWSTLVRGRAFGLVRVY